MCPRTAARSARCCRGSATSGPCWWSATLGDGPKRFNEIRRALGSISQRMLTLTLRGAGARRAGHAHGVPDHSAAGRLRTDQARPFAARAGERAWPVGAAEPRRRSRRRGGVSTRPATAAEMQHPRRTCRGLSFDVQAEFATHAGSSRAIRQQCGILAAHHPSDRLRESPRHCEASTSRRHCQHGACARHADARARRSLTCSISRAALCLSDRRASYRRSRWRSRRCRRAARDVDASTTSSRSSIADRQRRSDDRQARRRAAGCRRDGASEPRPTRE